jgi:hypothetical protein
MTKTALIILAVAGVLAGALGSAQAQMPTAGRCWDTASHSILFIGQPLPNGNGGPATNGFATGSGAGTGTSGSSSCRPPFQAPARLRAWVTTRAGRRPQRACLSATAEAAKI